MANSVTPLQTGILITVVDIGLGYDIMLLFIAPPVRYGDAALYIWRVGEFMIGTSLRLLSLDEFGRVVLR